MGYLDDGTTGFPVLENHRLCFGIMLISLQSKQVNKAGVNSEQAGGRLVCVRKWK